MDFRWIHSPLYLTLVLSELQTESEGCDSAAKQKQTRLGHCEATPVSDISDMLAPDICSTTCPYERFKNFIPVQVQPRTVARCNPFCPRFLRTPNRRHVRAIRA